MKALLFSIFTIIGLASFSQIPKPGTYIYKYCDMEYNKCLSTCKVVIKGNHITIYATKELSETITGTAAGDIINKGTIIKNKSGEWIIKPPKNKDEEDSPTKIDFKKKQYWQL